MPEGVEVKLSVDIIKPLLINKRVINAFPSKSGRYKLDKPEGFDDFIKYLETNDCRITNVESKGKFMYWSFTGYWYLMNTFGMSGQWSQQEGKHSCFGFYLGEDPTQSFETMYFNDPRHFGTIKFVNSYALLNLKLAYLGWDPLNDGESEQWLQYVTNALSRTSKPIGQILMDQSIFAGVGNYIRAEALYSAKISPWRPCNQITADEKKVLYQALMDVMGESYKYQGATILTYKDAYGAEGKYSSCFKVYGQKQDPLGNKIIKQTTPEGRTIHWCPSIQK